MSEWLEREEQWKDICKDGHSYFLRSMTPRIPGLGYKEGGGIYEYECNLCSAKLVSDKELDFATHPQCLAGNHLWYPDCQLCCPGGAHCARLCGAVPPGHECKCGGKNG